MQGKSICKVSYLLCSRRCIDDVNEFLPARGDCIVFVNKHGHFIEFIAKRKDATMFDFG